jgi:hypothetical protein
MDKISSCRFIVIAVASRRIAAKISAWANHDSVVRIRVHSYTRYKCVSKSRLYVSFKLDLILLCCQCLKGLACLSLHRCRRKVLKEVFLSRLFQVDILFSSLSCTPEKCTGFTGDNELWNYNNYPKTVLEKGYRAVGIACRGLEFIYGITSISQPLHSNIQNLDAKICVV